MSIPEVNILINNEQTVLRTLPDSPFIVRLLETFREDDYFYLVYEYCSGGSLLDLMETSQFTE